MQDGLAGTGDQYLRQQHTGRGLQSSGPAEGPPVLPRGGQATACYLGFQRGPAREAVLASQCQLRCREGYSRRDRTKPTDGVRLTVDSGAEQFSRLTAKLVKIRSVRKPGHDVSSAPGPAFRRDKKTILPGKHDATPIMEVDAVLPASPAASSSAVPPGYPTPRPARFTTDLATTQSSGYAGCCQPKTAC